jgi:SAM-dependent methyltransferase
MAKVEGQPAEQLLRTRAELVPYQWHLHRSLEAARRAFDGPHARRLALAIAVIYSAMTPEDRDVLVAVTPDTTNLLATLRGVVKATDEGRGQLAEVVAVLLRNLSGHNEVVGRLMRTMHLLMTAGIELVRLAEDALERLPAGETDEGGVMSTSESLSMMIEAVGQPAPGSSVLDLASGEGNLLLHLALTGAKGLVLTGCERDRTACAIAEARFHLHDIPATIRNLDSLRDDHDLGPADLVVVDPPLETRKTYRKWLDRARSSINANGRAVVVLPLISIGRGRREWREVGDASAAIVVAAPNRLRGDRGDSLVLWVLEAEPGPDLLLINASQIGEQVDVSTAIARTEIDILASTVDRWRREHLLNDGVVNAVAINRHRASEEALATIRELPGHPEPLPPVGGATADGGGLDRARALLDQLADVLEGPLGRQFGPGDRAVQIRALGQLRDQLGRPAG